MISPFPTELLLAELAPQTPVPHCESIVAHIAPDFFALWDAYEKEQQKITEIPYWAAVWPGAKSLASYLLKNPALVSGKTILDFGSGSGVVSIASVLAGAGTVVANDIDPIAQYVALRNFNANKVSVVTTSENLLTVDNNVHYDLILVCDMFYERSTAKPLHEYLKKRISKGSQVIIADGTRPFTPHEDLHVILSETIVVNQALEGMAKRNVTLFQMV